MERVSLEGVYSGGTGSPCRRHFSNRAVAETRYVDKAMLSDVMQPLFPAPQDRSTNLLLIRNEGSRSLQIIGDLVAEDAKVMPGASFEMDLASLDGPVQLIFCDGGIQLDCAGAAPHAIEDNVDLDKLWPVSPVVPDHEQRA